MDSQKQCFGNLRSVFLLWLLIVGGLLALNVVTQPYEDEISLVPPEKAYYLDVVWYIDDILGPSLFMLAGVSLLIQTRLRFKLWPLIGLGLSCVAFSLGDTADLHWVLTTGAKVAHEGVSFSSWMSKVMVVILFCFFVIHAHEHLSRPAQKAVLFAFTLLYIDQIQMSISLDFAGYSFHVFEETLEVVTGLFFCMGLAFRRIPADQLNTSQG
jgi:hypothetical protein